MLLLLEDKTIIAVVAESDVSAGDIVASAEHCQCSVFVNGQRAVLTP